MFWSMRGVLGLALLGIALRTDAQLTCHAGQLGLEFRVHSVVNSIQCQDGSTANGVCDLFVVVGYTGAPTPTQNTSTVSLGGGVGGACHFPSPQSLSCVLGGTSFTGAAPLETVCLAGTATSFTVTVQVMEDGSIEGDRADTALTFPMNVTLLTTAGLTGIASSPVFSGYRVHLAYSFHSYTLVCGQNISGDTSDATAIAGSSVGGSEDHVYLFTPPAPGLYEFNLCRSSFFPFLTFYEYTDRSQFGLGTRLAQCSGSCGSNTIIVSSNPCPTSLSMFVLTNLTTTAPIVLVIEAASGSSSGVYFIFTDCLTGSPTSAPSPRQTTAPVSLAPTTQTPTSSTPVDTPTSLPTRVPTSPPVTQPPASAPATTPSPTTEAPTTGRLTAEPEPEPAQPTGTPLQPTVAQQPAFPPPTRQPTTQPTTSPAVPNVPTTAAPPTPDTTASNSDGAGGDGSTLLIVSVVVVLALLVGVGLWCSRCKNDKSKAATSHNRREGQPAAVPAMFVNPLHRGAAAGGMDVDAYETSSVAHTPQNASSDRKDAKGKRPSAAPAGFGTYESPVAHNPDYATAPLPRDGTLPSPAPDGLGTYQVFRSTSPGTEQATVRLDQQNYVVGGAGSLVEYATTAPQTQGSGSRTVVIDPTHASGNYAYANTSA
eukprot:m.86194 g.86194  ORF g.86194 m.86194 type:complete len:652 (-) comp19826_c0_seq2:33-1988(-)